MIEKKMKRVTIGIDEVGRGALAGPVVVAAAMLACPLREIVPPSILKKLGALKDSKKLSAKKREAWYAYFAAHPNIEFAVARVYPRQIEKRNISGAANLAAWRAYKKVTANKLPSSEFSAPRSVKVFLDGGLYLANKSSQLANGIDAKTMPKADENIPAVAIASIVAKVHRDRLMVKLAKQYPTYGFDIHKGYGTHEHMIALKKNGISDLHRATFCGNI